MQGGTVILAAAWRWLAPCPRLLGPLLSDRRSKAALLQRSMQLSRVGITLATSALPGWEWRGFNIFPLLNILSLNITFSFKCKSPPPTTKGQRDACYQCSLCHRRQYSCVVFVKSSLFLKMKIGERFPLRLTSPGAEKRRKCL